MLNQCANDWITCRCGKVFGDTKMTAKSKFIRHLRKEKVEEFEVDFCREYITRVKKSQTDTIKNNGHLTDINGQSDTEAKLHGRNPMEAE